MNDFFKWLSLRSIKEISVLLLSPQSPWINDKFVAKRKYSSREEYIKEIEASHKIVESGVTKLSRAIDAVSKRSKTLHRQANLSAYSHR